MLIGVPKEIKNHEYRVAMTPDGVRALVAAGHSVRVQAGAGAAIGFADAAYREAGAEIADSAAEVWRAGLVVKVKEPQASEAPLLQTGQLLFCYLHLAAEAKLAKTLIEKNVTAIGYETVTEAGGGFPLLRPMSEIAGRMAPQMGALGLMLPYGGNGTLVAGVPGVWPARITVIGGGSVGMNAVRAAVGLGAQVRLLDRSAEKLRHAEELYGARCETAFATDGEVARAAREADIVIGAAMVAGRRAPHILTRAHLRAMRPGSVLVDVSIDQGGIAETSRPTTHSEPFYLEEGIVHYCVSNMPGAVARTATLALTQATLPFVMALANRGIDAAAEDPHLGKGLQIQGGKIVYPGLAEDIEKPH
ncbi:alanine dehydrogenase [Betaproteobacteria bacterium SCN2]|jgi:alanine dehydrogenase|nr:alanine dehydrogenase [Betaproteobacteria bacterium SCN2]